MSKYFFKIFICLVLGVLLCSFKVFAMDSANYNIDKDSINFSGTDDNNSANYQLRDTVGEISTGLSDSANYGLSSGYRTTDGADPTLSFSLSTNSINLGVLSQLAISSGQVTTNVITNALAGYNITIQQDGEFRTNFGAFIDPVLDGAVTIGSEEYGVRTGGADGLYNSNDTNIISTPKAIASKNSATIGSTITVDFKAAISPETTSGVYRHKVTFIATGNF